MAFTTGVDRAQCDDGHAVEILAAGHVRNLRLYNLPGDEYYQHKGDLWNITLLVSTFHSNVSTLVKSSVSIIEHNDDGWNIDSIVTLVGAGGC